MRVNTTNATGTTVNPAAGTITFGNRNQISYSGIESVSTTVVTVAATDADAAERGAERPRTRGSSR